MEVHLSAPRVITEVAVVEHQQLALQEQVLAVREAQVQRLQSPVLPLPTQVVAVVERRLPLEQEVLEAEEQVLLMGLVLLELQTLEGAVAAVVMVHLLVSVARAVPA